MEEVVEYKIKESKHKRFLFEENPPFIISAWWFAIGLGTGILLSLIAGLI